MSHRKTAHHGHALTLDQLEIGGRGKVMGISGESEIRRRLLEMGFTIGAHVAVVRRAPMGDPIEFELRGYHLSLRAAQARHVRIEKD